ncbi:MAG TPA: class II glutamine amidotransferase [Geminicoccaceae bacterium]|nr:class II glutamine amidotransferase [Geminicoccaceae bacterium]
MCRFYALRATAPTRVECGLVHAPNSLLAQSRQDLHGFEHADGWGIAAYRADGVAIERQPRAAHDGRRFRAAAARLEAITVLAHVRHATVGATLPENTHPFAHGAWTFVHNGTVPYFAEVRDALLAAMTAEHRAAIVGQTDSEHLFHFILSSHEQAPRRPLLTTLQLALQRVVAWCRERGHEPHLGLNVLLTDGAAMVGSRWQRTLHCLEVEGLADCPVCGRPHAACGERYRALEIASEPTTDEPWREVPERSVFEVTPELRLRVQPLAAE